MPMDDADHLLGVAEEVGGEAVELAVIRDEDRAAQRAQGIDAVEEIDVVDLPGGAQVLEGHLHEDDDLLPGDLMAPG